MDDDFCCVRLTCFVQLIAPLFFMILDCFTKRFASGFTVSALVSCYSRCRRASHLSAGASRGFAYGAIDTAEGAGISAKMAFASSAAATICSLWPLQQYLQRRRVWHLRQETVCISHTRAP